MVSSIEKIFGFNIVGYYFGFLWKFGFYAFFAMATNEMIRWKLFLWLFWCMKIFWSILNFFLKFSKMVGIQSWHKILLFHLIPLGLFSRLSMDLMIWFWCTLGLYHEIHNQSRDYLGYAYFFVLIKLLITYKKILMYTTIIWLRVNKMFAMDSTSFTN